MPLKDQIKDYAKKLIESKPDGAALQTIVRARKPATYQFDDDDIVPNHPRWPVIVYRKAIRFPRNYDPATVIDAVFAANDWGDRGGIPSTISYITIPKSTKYS